MAQYKIIKTVDFGPYTIIGASGLQSDHVPLNNYAPKIGDVIEGVLETKSINDGNGHIVTKTGITWPIMTNGTASTTGQTSIQFISQDHFEPAVVPSGGGSGDEPTPNPMDPAEPSTPETPKANPMENSVCWICDNKIPVLIGILLLIGLFFILNKD